MTSPIILSIISRQADLESLQQSARAIIKRNLDKRQSTMSPNENPGKHQSKMLPGKTSAKNPPTMPLSKNSAKNQSKTPIGKKQGRHPSGVPSNKNEYLDQFILTNGNSQEHEDTAFAALKKRGIQNNDKIYLMTHGDECHLEMPPKGKSESSLDAEQLAQKFMKQGGLETAIRDHIQTLIHPSQNSATSNDFNLKIRLLSCLAGKEKEGTEFNPTSFVEMFNHDLIQRINQVIRTEQGTSFEKAKFSITLETKAPRGWNIILPNGSTMSYFTNPRLEKKVDREFKQQFDQIRSKQDVPKTLQPYVLEDNRKSRIVKSAIRKYQGQTETYIDTDLSTETK